MSQRKASFSEWTFISIILAAIIFVLAHQLPVTNTWQGIIGATVYLVIIILFFRQQLFKESISEAEKTEIIISLKLLSQEYWEKYMRGYGEVNTQYKSKSEFVESIIKKFEDWD